MKKNIYILLALLCIGVNIHAQLPTYEWTRSLGGTNTEQTNAVISDALGNVYCTGVFSGTVDFDPSGSIFNLTAAGANDVFICKLNASGFLVWAKKIGSTLEDKSTSIAMDKNNNIYISGYFNGTVDFDPGSATTNLISFGQTDIFVAKYNTNGDLVWARQLGGSNEEEANAIAIDQTGHIYTTGFFKGTADFDPSLVSFTLSTPTNKEIFVSQLDSMGNFGWAKKLGGGSDDIGKDIKTDHLNNVYTTGSFRGTADFNPSTSVTDNLIAAGSEDIFVSKLDSLGNYSWAKSMGGSNQDEGNSLCIDASGAVTVTGIFLTTADFDPGSGVVNLISSGSYDSFIARLNASGDYQWAIKIGNTGADRGMYIQCAQDKSLYTTGVYIGTVNFGSISFTSNGSEDIYITKLDTLGNFTWIKSIGGSGSDFSEHLHLDKALNVFTSGYFTGSVDFNPDSPTDIINAIGINDAFVQKLNDCSIPPNAVDATPPANLSICQGNATTLNATGTGTLYWYSSSTGGSILASGNSYTTPVLSAGTYTYYLVDSTCSSSATRTGLTVTVNTCTDISENKNEMTLGVYPNPNKGVFTLELREQASIRIFTAVGQILFRKDLSAGQHLIELQPEVNELLFIESISNGGRTLSKVMVQPE